MNKNAIRIFAVWARRKLLEQVEDKVKQLKVNRDGSLNELKRIGDAVFIGGKIYSKDILESIDKLVKRIKEIGYDAVIEEVAYTWFNRFIALRYMEVNGYLPSGIRVLSSTEEGRKEPDILQNALSVNLPVDKNKIIEYKEKNMTEELYKYLLIKQCNELNKILPFLFEKINDYTELLLPDNLLKEESVIMRLVNDIEEDDFKEGVEIIGWLYQFYVSEKHEQVVGIDKGTIQKKDIPAATQLFTPKWIVKYMIDNTLGKIWIENKNDVNLEKKLDFYLGRSKQNNIAFDKLKNANDNLTPENIKILDSACGSGHILVYAFDILYDIYLSVGYLDRDIPKLIIENNLYGLDIDDRAAQLAAFAVVMKAREKNRRFFKQIEREGLNLNIVSIKETNSVVDDNEKFTVVKEILTAEVKDKRYAEEQIQNLFITFYDAKEYGSIIEVKDIDHDFWKERLEFIKSSTGNLKDMDYNVFAELKEILPYIVKQAEIMDKKYDVVVTNPPYLNRKVMPPNLKKYIDRKFSDFNGDLFSVFIIRNLRYTKLGGYAGFMSPFVWMFIQTYQKLREFLIDNKVISSLIQLEYGAFEEAVVPICTFVIHNQKVNYLGDYIRLSDFKGAENQPIKVLEAIKNPDVCYRYRTNQKDFKSIPGSPIAYWVSDKVREIFQRGTSLSDIAEPRQGLATSDNNRFLRLWYEVDINNIGFGFKDRDEAKESNLKWFPYNKGGDFRKWYGNNEYVVNWYNDGEELKEFASKLYRNYTRTLKNIDYYFKEGITWSFVSSSKFGVRYTQKGFIFDVGGSSIFPPDDKINVILGFLCSKLSFEFLKTLNPTLNFQVGNIGSLPYIDPGDYKPRIDALVQQNISISKADWDSRETSWDFEEHPILKHKDGADTIEEAFNNWRDFAEKQFNRLKANEEELNRIFIDIYGLQDELTPDVDDRDVTINKADLTQDIKSFISYAVGCMLGRYSLDRKGLVYAGGAFDWDAYKTFKPDEDGIIPVLESEYFEDDIVTRFVQFVKVVFGEKTLAQNLEFIANALGRKENEMAVDTIRKYFLNDFYKDHVKTYQKKPIYWLFTSGKEKAFNAFIYMHRYDKNTIARIRTDYLHELQKKMNAEMIRVDNLLNNGGLSPKEKRDYDKYLNKLKKQMKELKDYDILLKHYADLAMDIDLDDGVKANYAKFQDLLAKI